MINSCCVLEKTPLKSADKKAHLGYVTVLATIKQLNQPFKRMSCSKMRPKPSLPPDKSYMNVK